MLNGLIKMKRGKKGRYAKIEATFDELSELINDYVSMNMDLLIGKYNTKNKIQEG